jgi:hypothetical protein
MAAPPLHLPPAYLRGFAAPPLPGESEPCVWAFRAALGAWRRWPVARAPGPERHFNDAEPGALDALAPLWQELEALSPRVSPLLGDGLAAPRTVSPGERAELARFLALVALRNARGAGGLPAAEARAGVDSIAGALEEMGWVLWAAGGRDYFIGSSSPLHLAYPAGDSAQTTGFDVTAPQVEVSVPLSPRVALHATWRRRGELWRPAREEVVLEINGRTCAGARTFLFSPQPEVPG